MSDRAIEDKRLLGRIRALHEETGSVYGSPRIFLDLREEGETCGIHRVERIMKVNRIKAVRGYKRHKYVKGEPSVLAPNYLQREFTADHPNCVWVTDFTYIRSWQGWLYLAAVMDSYSRKIVGWSMKANMTRELVLDAILMAVWRRKPKNSVLVHSGQGSKYGSDDWHRFCRDNGLTPSTSRRGDCWDNAVAESFFSSLKVERVRQKIYPSRNKAREDLFDYIEMFYNPKRLHSHVSGLSPEAFERASNHDL